MWKQVTCWYDNEGEVTCWYDNEGEVWDPIITVLTQPHFFSCPKSGQWFPTSYIVVFFCIQCLEMRGSYLFCLNWFCLRFTFSSWSASVCFVSDLPSLHDQLLFVLFKLVLSQIYLLFMISFKFSSVHIDSVHLHIQCRISTIYCTLYSYWTIKEMSNCQMKIHLLFLDRNFVNSQMM